MGGQMEQRGGPYVLERNYAAGPDERGKRPQGGTGLGQILQDRSANCCVEEFAAREASDVAFDETHAGKPGLRDAGSRCRNRGRVSLDSHHLARRADEPRRQQRDVGDAGADVEHPLPGADASVAEEALGERIPDRRLTDQPVMFGACGTQDIGRIGGLVRHERGVRLPARTTLSKCGFMPVAVLRVGIYRVREKAGGGLSEGRDRPQMRVNGQRRAGGVVGGGGDGDADHGVAASTSSASTLAPSAAPRGFDPTSSWRPHGREVCSLCQGRKRSARARNPLLLRSRSLPRIPRTAYSKARWPLSLRVSG
jgi:hypothetical protein